MNDLPPEDTPDTPEPMCAEGPPPLGDMERSVLTREDGVRMIVRRGYRVCPNCGDRWGSTFMGTTQLPVCPRPECDRAELGPLEPLGQL